MSDDWKKPPLERKTRTKGMSDEKRAAMKQAMAGIPAMVRCWSCGKNQTGLEHELHDCQYCGKNLWRRS